MANNKETFQRFADEVRSSSGFMTAKFKAIKISTEEARRCFFDNEADNKEAGGEVIAIPLRPETPGNIRGLYRMVKRDVLRLRETFKSIATDSVNIGDVEQVDRLIRDLEKQLHLATVELEKLKSGRPKTSRPRKKSARQSAKRPVETDDSNKENNASELKDTFTGMKRPVAMPPVVSTKLKKPHQGRSSASTNERKPSPKKRAWGAFHGHKTLSRERSEIPSLPPAPDSTSLVSSASDSEKSQNSKGGNAPFTYVHAPNNFEPSRVTREKTHFKPINTPAAKMFIRKEGSFNLPNPRHYSRHDAFIPARKLNREFTNLETVDLNVQVDKTMKASPVQRIHSNVSENPGIGEQRKPSYLISRSKTIPETVLERRVHIRKPAIGYPFASSFPELPPLASLKRTGYPPRQQSKYM